MQDLEEALSGEPVQPDSRAEEPGLQEERCCGDQVQEQVLDGVYIQAEGGELLMQHNPLSSEGIVIENVPDVVTTTTTHNQAPQGSALENALAIEADGSKSADANVAGLQH